MGRREDFENSLWSDPEFLALSPDARLLYIWTWTNPRCGMSGLYKLAPAAAAYETGLGEDCTLAALEELGDARFAFYEDGVVFVRTRVKHLRQKTTQIAKAIRNDLKQISNDHPLKKLFRETYEGPDWLCTAFQGDPQEGPIDPAHPVDPQVRVHGTGGGTGTGRGRSFRRARANKAAVPYSPDPWLLDVHAEHFPAHQLSEVEGAAFKLQLRGRDVTVPALRDLIEGRAAA